MNGENPFTLTFGKRRLEYISRYETVDFIVQTFSAANPPSQTFLIEGVRGCGKTVLLTIVEKELATRGDWVVIDLNSTRNLLADLAMRLADACRGMPDVLKSGFSLSVAGFGIGINGEEKQRDDVSLIEEALGSLMKKNKRVLITIDEVLPGQDMRHFASQFQIFLRQDYPVFLVMTGLYENIYAVQNDPALTFLLRTPKIALEPLSLFQITKQYKEIFATDDETAKKLARTTKGYAFAFQALGMLYFEYGDAMPFEDILSKFDEMLDDFVYKKIWSSLSGQDRNIICAIGDDKAKVKDVCEKTGMQSSSFSKYRERLSRRGILDTSQHGWVSLLLPRFAEVARMYM